MFGASRRVRLDMPPAPLDAEGFADAVDVSRETLDRLSAYAELLRRWTARINLVSRASLGDLWRRHILDSAQLAAFIPSGAAGLIDLGSGAGLPGLVLAILGVAAVELVEADLRKCAFLSEAARVTETPIRIHACRIEMVPPHPRAIITARGCAPLERLLPLAYRFFGPGTRLLLLKGERVTEELTAARRDWTIAATSHASRSDPSGVVLCVEQADRRARVA